MYKKFGKRLLDIVLSLTGIIMLGFPMIIVSLIIKMQDKGPVLFTQKRIGMNKKTFMIYKFRSMKMSTPKDTPTHLLLNPEQYLLPIGGLLRKLSIDELPQLINILKGEMSIIGPRPALWNQYDLIKERDKYGANDVRPGLTGWAQINGRDELEIVDKAKYDGEYVKNINFAMDIKCFFGTILSVIKKEGVVEGGTGELKNRANKEHKILFLANHFITLYSFRKELINKLVEDGYEVYLSIPEDENDYFKNIGCHVIATEIDRRGINPKNDIKLILFYKKIIPQINPEIIFSYTIKPNIYGTFVTNRKYKQICNITGTGGTFLEDNLISKICKVLYKISVRNCYKVFFQNEGDRTYFIENKLVKDNHEILPGSGCNLEEYEFYPIPKGNTIKFIFIGRVMKLKGIEEYLEAARIIKKKYNNTEFIIAGWNEEEKYKKILEEYQEKEYINYVGFQKSIIDWIIKCDCTILPSHGGEGIPNVLLESAATGRICIGSNINGTSNVIEDEVTGFLFKVGSTEDLVNKIEKFINLNENKRNQMECAARKKIESEFDRNIVIRKYYGEISNR